VRARACICTNRSKRN